MAIYKCSREVEPGATGNKFTKRSERVLNPGSPDLKASALTTGPHCLRTLSRYRHLNHRSKYTTKYYCIKGSCIKTRFPYYNPSLLHIPPEANYRLQQSLFELIHLLQGKRVRCLRLQPSSLPDEREYDFLVLSPSPLRLTCYYCKL